MGGLSVGEPKDKMIEMVSICGELLPETKPRYLMDLSRQNMEAIQLKKIWLVAEGLHRNSFHASTVFISFSQRRQKGIVPGELFCESDCTMGEGGRQIQTQPS